jgi:hypothetical protein
LSAPFIFITATPPSNVVLLSLSPSSFRFSRQARKTFTLHADQKVLPIVPDIEPSLAHGCGAGAELKMNAGNAVAPPAAVAFPYNVVATTVFHH